MKKSILNLLMLLIPMVTMLSSCDEEEIIFDHEKPQFEIKSDAILLELIVPQGTAVDDEIFIAGAFNGGEEAALADVTWQLEKSPTSDVKWGIYLYPSTFVDGKTLADGFYFVSKAQGAERSVKGEEVMHSLNVGVGTRTNVTADRWKAYFDVPDEPGKIEHDGYVVYVIDETGWDGLALYAWGSDLPELFGGWPGIQPTGVEEKDGVSYKYFDTGEANKGLTYNLIFNNNGAGKQFDGPAYTLDHDIYLHITDGAFEIIDHTPVIKHDGYAIFVEDKSEWEITTLYAWGSDLPELFGGWPGVQPTGEITINGINFKYYDTGEANKGLTYNLIFNNNNGGKQFDGPSATLDRDYYLSITDKKWVEIDPFNPTEPEPDPEPTPTDEYTIYVQDLSTWDALAIYAWGTDLPDLFGGWPGLLSTTTVEKDGITYKCFPCKGQGETYNLIFNNNGAGSQIDGPSIAVNRDYYFKFDGSAITEITE